jgi:hypothetical protein
MCSYVLGFTIPEHMAAIKQAAKCAPEEPRQEKKEESDKEKTDQE